MSARLENYLRTYRKRFGFSQTEIAILLGNQSRAMISRYERQATRPPLETALAYEAIFRVSAGNLFAGLYEKVEKEIAIRARLLAEKLAEEGNRKKALRKLVALDAIAS
jgi:transcriptional regulator with XRE-family HTH domain